MEFRTTRPTQPIEKDTKVQPEAPQPSNSQPRPSYRLEPPRSVGKKSSWLKRAVLGVVALVVLGATVLYFLSDKKDASTAIDSSKYQAVFLTDGIVYFGKLKPFTKDAMKLTDIYYPQVQASNTADTEKTAAAAQQGNVNLIKRSNDIHGPENEMIIRREYIMYYENLRTDSKVTQLIEQQKPKP